MKEKDIDIRDLPENYDQLVHGALEAEEPVEQDDFISEKEFRQMLTDRTLEFRKNIPPMTEGEEDIYRAMLSIICGVLADIPKTRR